MNKKELSAFRRQFKADSYQLDITQLYTAYIKKDNQNLMYAELCSFDMKNESEQEIYLSNFKKLLTGSFNQKLFELSFDETAPEGEGREACNALLDASREAFAERCNEYIAKIALNYTYDSDVVISFAAGKYNKPMGKKRRKGEEESLDGFDDTTFGFKFVLCSICKAEDTKRGIFYSASSEKFELSSALDKTVNFLSPIDGFMFPALSDGGADINKLIYYTGKANVRNEALLTNVLHCQYEPTAKEEQEKFEELLRLVSGAKIKPEVVKNIYEAVNEKIEAYADAGEPVTLDAGELRDIFEESGVEDLSGFEEAFNQTVEEGFAFKADSLAAGAALVRISSGITEFAVNLADLGAVRQVINQRGRKCLQIELGEDAELGGLTLETENI